MGQIAFTDATSTAQYYDADGAGTVGSPFAAKAPALLGALTASPAATPSTTTSISGLIRGFWQAVINLGTPAVITDFTSMGVAVSGYIGPNVTLYRLAATNLAATTRYIQLFESTFVIAGDVPRKSYPVFADGFTQLGPEWFGSVQAGKGLVFSSGLSWGISSTALFFTPVAASETIFEMGYV
jgi:hypothetical protein